MAGNTFLYLLGFALALWSQSCEPKLILKESKLLPFAASSMALTFLAEVFNDGNPHNDKDVPPVRLEMIKCCQKLLADTRQEPDCESMKLHSGLFHRINAGQRKSLLTFYPTKHVVSRIGYCLFRIHGAPDIEPFRIDFNTVTGFELGSQKVSISANPCKHLDENPLLNCYPVECSEKYNGYRSFFNLTIDVCEPTPICLVSNEKQNSKLQHKEEHKPDLVLDPNYNKCENGNRSSPEKRLKVREIKLFESAKNMTVKSFAEMYGFTLAKLSVAVVLTLVFLFTMCMIVKFCCCCLPCCGFLKDENAKTTTAPKTKYMPIINEPDCRIDSSTKLIREVRDRREMGGPKRVSSLKPYTTEVNHIESRNSSRESSGKSTHESSLQSPAESRHSSNDSNNESPKGNMSGATMNAAGESQSNIPSKNYSVNDTETRTSKASSKGTLSSESSRGSVKSKKMPNIAQILHQVESIQSKKSDYNSSLRLELERAFGRDMTFPENRHNKSNRSRPQDSCKSNSQVLKLDDVPPQKHVFYRIQEPSQRGNRKTKESVNGPRTHSNTNRNPSNKFREIDISHIPKENVNKIEADPLPSDLSFSHWTNIPSTTSVQRFYKAEMAKAASFLRELEQRKSGASSDYFEKRPLHPEQLTAEAKFTMKPTVAKAEPLMKSSGSKPMRRIKDEPPIPLSMIYSETRLNNIVNSNNVTKSKELPIPDLSLSWEQQQDATFSNFQSPVFCSTPKHTLTSPTSPVEKFYDTRPYSSTNPFSFYNNYNYNTTTNIACDSKTKLKSQTILEKSILDSEKILQKSMQKSQSMFEQAMQQSQTVLKKATQKSQINFDALQKSKIMFENPTQKSHITFDTLQQSETMLAIPAKKSLLTFDALPKSETTLDNSSQKSQMTLDAIQQSNATMDNLEQKPQTTLEIPVQFEVPKEFKSKLAPFADVKTFAVPFSVKLKDTSSVGKFEETSHAVASTSFENETEQETSASEKAWVFPSRERSNDDKFRIVKEINSQKLLHSPPCLSQSETSIEGSECLENRNDPKTTCFFDDYLQPLRRPSVSDEVLTSNRWIDNFRNT